MFKGLRLLTGLFAFSLFVLGSNAEAGPRIGTTAVIVPSIKVTDGPGAAVDKASVRNRTGLLRRAKITWSTIRTFRNAWLAAEEPSEADRLAKTSRKIGIIGISCLGGVIIPYIGSAAFLGALVLGIIAIVQGRSARRLGTKLKTGETLGYITVGVWTLMMILALAAVYLLLIGLGG